jgi:hypothetical protein
LRQQIEDAGGLKLIYIDPPFDVGADFSMDIEIGGETFHKEPNLLEQIAYRDTWGRGTDSFISMIYERLILMRDLMANDASIYLHCDYRVTALIRHAWMKCLVKKISGMRLFGGSRHRERAQITSRGNTTPFGSIQTARRTISMEPGFLKPIHNGTSSAVPAPRPPSPKSSAANGSPPTSASSLSTPRANA